MLTSKRRSDFLVDKRNESSVRDGKRKNITGGDLAGGGERRWFSQNGRRWEGIWAIGTLSNGPDRHFQIRKRMCICIGYARKAVLYSIQVDDTI